MENLSKCFTVISLSKSASEMIRNGFIPKNMLKHREPETHWILCCLCVHPIMHINNGNSMRFTPCQPTNCKQQTSHMHTHSILVGFKIPTNPLMPEIKWWREDRVGTPRESSHIATVSLKWTLLFQLCSAKNLKCANESKDRDGWGRWPWSWCESGV